MTEPISLVLSQGQIDEFAALAREEQNARLVLDRCPIAGNYAARAILLGAYPLAAFDGANIHIDLDRGVLTFAPNAVLPALASEPQPEAVS